MSQIKPAENYTSCSDLWVITTYFNTGRDAHRLANYYVFAESLKRSGIQLLTVECAFCEDSFELALAVDIIQARSRDILWQKERLLNLAVTRLPQTAHKVAWIDGDNLFDNPAWAVQTSALLDEYPVVQLWESAIRLPLGHHAPTGREQRYQSMASILSKDPWKIGNGAMDIHGQTGFGWAARRDLLDQCGLYDMGFDVGADHLIAHALWGEFDHPCVRPATGMGVMQNSFLRRNSSPTLSLLRSIVPESVKSRIAP